MQYLPLLQRILSDLNKANISLLVEELNDTLDDSQETVDMFIQTFFSFLRARPTIFDVFCSFLAGLRIILAQNFHNSLVQFLKLRVSQPNEQELCVFIYYLLKNDLISVDEVICILKSLFEHPESVSNLVFVQLLYLAFYSGGIIERFNEDAFKTLYQEFNIRKSHISIGSYNDENSPLFLDMFEQLELLRENKWKIPESFPYYILIRSIQSNDNVALTSLLNNGQDPNEHLPPTLLLCSPIISFSPTLLALAAFLGSDRCFMQLINSGASVDEIDDESRPISSFAAASKNINILRILHENNADFVGSLSVSVEFWRFESFLWINEHVFPKLKSVIEQNNDFFIHSAAKVNNLQMLELFMKKGLSFTVFDDYNWSPLHISVSHNCFESTFFILSNNLVDPNIEDLDNNTPLHCAAQEGNIKIINLLLSTQGVDINYADGRGATPLHWAACYNQSEAIKALLSNPKILPNKLDLMNRSPLVLSIISKSINSFRSLLSDSRIDLSLLDREKNSPLIHAVQTGIIDFVQAILSRNSSNINHKNESNKTALEYAVIGKHSDIVRYLKGFESCDSSFIDRIRDQIDPEIYQILVNN